ncbi:SDR family NAD(P)-dependent oxidoreductase, partial [Streptomyces sp. PU_AKi4]|uniref:SDR family NAD(P)-dependent oxidoreductase n=1 Tax=Streptomyces sp. PU_AKi4 TaxID=2800809 RepID=UPI0035247F48
GGSTAPGAMAAVLGAVEREVAALVAASGGELAVAAYNGPGRLVISGVPDAVREASRRLTGQGATVRPLRVSRAFHSPLMEPVARALSDAARALAPTAPTTPVMSTLTAAWQPPMTPDHLREHALRPVRFDRAVARLLEEGYDTFVDLGPTRTVAPTTGAFVVSAAEAAGGARELLETVARLWTRGVPVDRTALDEGCRRVPLPPCPYRRQNHWPSPGLLHDVVWRPTPPLPADGRAVVVTGADPAEARRLADRLARRGAGDAGTPETVILLAGTARPRTAADLEQHQHQAVTALREALALLDRTGARRLLVVTRDAHVTGHGAERPNPAQAILGGLALAVPQESTGVIANWIDLSSLDDEEQHLRALLTEASAPQAEGAVAWRAGQRSVRTVVPRTAEHADRTAPLPADGTYLITGGAGGIGSALARRLADRARPVLVLAGRSPRPPRGLLEELTALGADARYVTADLTVPDDVERLVAGLPPLDAVFHAAGVARPGGLRGTDVRETVDALGAKTLGTVLLAEALDRHGQRPGVCVAFSSVSSVLPGLAGALGAYAAANAFLDSFAGAERSVGRPW